MQAVEHHGSFHSDEHKPGARRFRTCNAGSVAAYDTAGRVVKTSRSTLRGKRGKANTRGSQDEPSPAAITALTPGPSPSGRGEEGRGDGCSQSGGRPEREKVSASPLWSDTETDRQIQKLDTETERSDRDTKIHIARQMARGERFGGRARHCGRFIVSRTGGAQGNGWTQDRHIKSRLPDETL